MKKKTALTVVLFVVAVLASTLLSYGAFTRLQTVEPAASSLQGCPNGRDGQIVASSANGGVVVRELKRGRDKLPPRRYGGVVVEQLLLT